MVNILPTAERELDHTCIHLEQYHTRLVLGL